MRSASQRRAGVVVWVDLWTTEVERAIHFYERLFGWHYDERDTPKGTYVVARVAEGHVGGIATQPPKQPASGFPSCWTVFVGTEHLETTISTIRERGGSVLQSPTSTPGGGRGGLIADPAGAVLGLMQLPAPEHWMVWGQAGGVVWTECRSLDPAASGCFYEGLFGWNSEEGTGGYVVFTLDGQRIGGLMTMPAGVPADVTSYWLVYFAADVPSTCARVAQLGGAVLEPTHEIAEGRFGVLQDPAGAVFAVFEAGSS